MAGGSGYSEGFRKVAPGAAGAVEVEDRGQHRTVGYFAAAAGASVAVFVIG